MIETGTSRDAAAGSAPLHYIDRSARLSVFGVLAILCGALCILLSLVTLMLPLTGETLGELAGAESGSPLAGFLMNAALGALLIWLGVGSMRKRRWVPTVMLTLSWTWLICGVILVPVSLPLLDDLLAVSLPGTEPAPAELLLVTKVIFVGLECVAGILLPALFIWAYSDRNLRLTCESHDPLPGWADRCSGPVLGLSLSLAALGVLALPLALNPAVPFFGLLITGWPAGALTLLAAIVCFYLSRSIYRLELAGWWGCALFLVLIGVSTVITFTFDANLVLLFRELGYPDSLATALLRSGRLLVVWGTALLTLLSLGYMWSLRKEFKTAPERSD